MQRVIVARRPQRIPPIAYWSAALVQLVALFRGMQGIHNQKKVLSLRAKNYLERKSKLGGVQARDWGMDKEALLSNLPHP